MKYNFAEMLALSADIHSNAGQLIWTHDELKNYVSRLASSWEDGSAREGYLQVQAQWDSAHNDIIDVLNTIAKTVENGTNDMQGTENKNAMSWT